MSGHYASFTSEVGYLNQPWAEAAARKWFGDAVVDALQRYVRTAKKGQLKNVIRFTKCVRGGWVRTGPSMGPGESSQGYVERRVGRIVKVEIVELPFRGEEKVLHEATATFEEEQVAQEQRRLNHIRWLAESEAYLVNGTWIRFEEVA